MEEITFLDELAIRLIELEYELEAKNNLSKNSFVLEEMLLKYDMAMDGLHNHKAPINRLMDY